MLKILINTSVLTLYFEKTNKLKWKVSLEQLIQPTGKVTLCQSNLKMQQLPFTKLAKQREIT